MSFDKILERILKAEGGYTNDPADHGGPTNFGITQADYAAFKGRAVSADDVKNMTLDEAKAIYKKKYWDAMGIDGLKDERIQLALFDQCVNRGTKTAIIQAQQVANTFGNKLSIDGANGPVTSGVINSIGVIDFCREFLQASELAYVDIVKRNSTQIVFLRGWLNRIHNLQDIIFVGNLSTELTPVKKPQPAPSPTTDEQKPIPIVPIGNPAYAEAKKYAGKTENDSTFNRWLSAFWAKVGLPGYKTIIGTSFAWCGLFIAAMNSESGQKFVSGAAGARNWAKYGVEIEWKKDGIPRGAVMHLNHAGNCSSGSNNHVTFADGDCAIADLQKADALVPGFGGNQGNTVKRSMYSVKEVCEVRWPSEIPKPGPIKASVGCSGAGSSESTR